MSPALGDYSKVNFQKILVHLVPFCVKSCQNTTRRLIATWRLRPAYGLVSLKCSGVVLQKLTPPQIRQFILYCYLSKEYV